MKYLTKFKETANLHPLASNEFQRGIIKNLNLQFSGYFAGDYKCSRLHLSAYVIRNICVRLTCMQYEIQKTLIRVYYEHRRRTYRF
jgi:hypothetical protein